MNILGFPLQPGEALLAATVPIFILFFVKCRVSCYISFYFGGHDDKIFRSINKTRKKNRKGEI